MAGHQLATVQRPRVGVPAAAHGGLKGHHVTGQGSGLQPQRLALGHQQGWLCRVGDQRRLQRRQQLAQAVAAHRQVGLGP